MENTLVRAGRIFLSVMFIFSGVSKLVSLPFFDGLVAELLIGADYYNHYQALWWVQVLTRVIVSAELLLGAALMQEYKFKQIVLPTTIGLLFVFTIQLIYEGFRSGFIDGNCGCFGDILPMNNLESILKNVAGMLIGGYVWLKVKDQKSTGFASWVLPFLLGLVTLATLWMTIKDYTPTQPTVIPSIFEEEIKTEIITDTTTTEDSIPKKEELTLIEPKTKQTLTKENPKETAKEVTSTNTPTPLEVTKNLINQYKNFSDGSMLNLEKGEKIVCMFSMTCGHCQEVYKDFCKIQQYASIPKLFLFNYGKEFEQNYFFNQSGGCKDAHIRLDDYAAFMRLLEGKSFPIILAFKDGKILKSWDIETYSKTSFLDFYGIKEKEVKTTNELGLEEENKDAELEF